MALFWQTLFFHLLKYLSFANVSHKLKKYSFYQSILCKFDEFQNKIVFRADFQADKF